MRHERRSRWQLVAVLLSLSLFAAACGGGNDGADEPNDDGGATPTTEDDEAVKGGTLVLGAEQEPDCLDVINTCGGSSWGYWIATAHTLPRAFDVTPKGGYEPSPMLDGEPKLDDDEKQVVTYKISDDAVWSDGTPITSSDFKYTWDQIANGDAVYSKTGYEDIESVDDSDPKTAVVTFKKKYAGWRDLFSAFYGLYPKHLLEGKDRNAETKDGYKFSGGPWIIESWNKGTDLTLVRNDKYWGKKANLDKVVFKFITDTSAELQAYKTGQVMAIYPQPQLELADQLKTLPDSKSEVNAGTTYEGLWFNTAKKPLDSQKVRQALAYATDREAIVNFLVKPLKEDAKVLNSFNVPNFPAFASDPYKVYKKDNAKVDELMKSDGWAKGSDGIWAKGGQKATLEINTTAGNKGREKVEELLQSQWKEAGFELKVNNTKAGTLFGEWGPQGVFVIGMYAQVGSPDPGLCTVFCSKNIPSPANEMNGQNWTRLASPAIDKPLEAVDSELDEKERAKLVKQAAKVMAEEVPALPLYQKLTTLIWSTKIGGPVGDNVTLGPFWNVNEWYLKK